MKKLISLALMSVVLALASSNTAYAQWYGANGIGQVFDSGSADAADYNRGQARTAGTALRGVVVDVRTVNVEASRSAKAVGAGLGGLLVGALASRNSSSYAASAVGGLLGAAVGGLAADHLGTERGQEIVVLLPGDRTIVVVQTGEPLSISDKVLVIQHGGENRVRKVAL